MTRHIRNSWIIFVTCLAFFGLMMVVAFAKDDAVSAAAETTVKIVKDKGHGSGFYVGGDYFVTAAHVVKGETSVRVVTSDGKEYTAQVMLYNRLDDIAILKTSGVKALTLAAVDCTPLVVGDTVSVRGSPMGLDFISTWGRVAGLEREVAYWRSAWVADMTVAPGNSGGPAFDEFGKVRGIVVGVTGWQGALVPFAIVVPSQAICRMQNLLD